MVITRQPVAGPSGSVMATAPVVELLDADGFNTTSTAAVTATILSPTTGGILGGATVNAVGGVATFSNLSLAGLVGTSYVLRFTSGSMTVDAAATSPTGPGSASQLMLTTAPVPGVSGAALGTQPVVAVQDSAGNTVTSSTAAVTVALVAGAGGTLGGTLTVNALNGVATFAGVTLAGVVGTPYTMRFSTVGLTAADATGVTVSSGFHTIGGANIEGAQATVPLADGSVLVAGDFTGNGSISFGTLLLTNRSSDTDGFVARMAADGSWLWATRFGGDAGDEVSNIAAFPDGSLVVVGRLGHTDDAGGTATFGDNTAPQQTVTLTSRVDGFVARINADGSWAWVRSITGDASAGADRVWGVATAADGSVVVGGEVVGTALVGGVTVAAESATTSRGWVGRLEGDNSAWRWVTPVAASERIGSVAIGSDGRILAAGRMRALAASRTSALVVQLTGTGTEVWRATSSETLAGSTQEVQAVVALADGGAVVAGAATTASNVVSLTPAATPLTFTVAGAGDGWVARLSASGQWQWLQPLSTSGTDDARTLSVLETDASGASGQSVLVGGRLGGPLAVGTLYSVSPRGGDSDAYVTELNLATGARLWTVRAGSAAANETPEAASHLSRRADGTAYAALRLQQGATQPMFIGNAGLAQTGAQSGQAVFAPLPVAGRLGWSDVASGAASAMAVARGEALTAVAGTAAAVSPQVVVLSSVGEPVSGVTVNFLVTSGGGSVATTSAVTNWQGRAGPGSWTLGTTAGPNALTATVAGLTGSPVTFSATGVTPATQVVLTTAPVGGASGAALATQPVVELRDGAGTLVTGDSTTVVTVSVAAGVGGSVGGTLTATAANGVATFSDVTLAGLAGTPYTLRFSAAGLAAADAPGVTVTPGVATQAVVTSMPVPGPSGAVMTTQPVVAIRDAQGNTVTSTPATTVTFSLIQGVGGTLSGPVAATTVNGVATFSGLVLAGVVGTGYTLRVTVPGYPSTDVPGIFVSGPGAPTQVSLSTAPVGGASGSALVVQPALTLRDSAGNIATGDSSTAIPVALVAGAGGSLGGTQTVTAVNGVVTFSGLTLAGVVGTGYTLRFSATGLTAVDAPGVTVVGPGPAAQLTVTTVPAGGASGTALTRQPAVTVRDAQGNTCITDNATLVTLALASGAGGTLGGVLSASSVNGVATFSGVTLAGVVGTGYTLRFSAAGLTAADAAGVTVSGPGTATQMAVQAGQGQTAPPNTAVPVAPAVVVRDAAGNGVPGIAVAFAVTSGGGVVVGATATTGAGGVATVDRWTLGAAPGAQTLTATVPGLVGSPVTITASAVGTPGVPPSLQVSPRDRALVVRWQAPPAAPETSPTAYVLQYRLQPDGPWLDGPALDAAQRTATLSGLTNGLRYDVRLATENLGGRSAWTALQAASPYRLDLRASEMTRLNSMATLVAIQWVYDGAGTPAFVIESIDVVGARVTRPVGSVTLFRQAAASGRYVVRVALAEDTAFENASNSVVLTVGAAERPATPTSLRVVVEGTRVTLAWTPNYTAGMPTETYLLVSGIPDPLPLGTGVSATFAEVPAGTYAVRVAAGNAVGLSAASSPVTLTVPGGCALPGTPAWVSVGLERDMGLVTWEMAATGGAPTDYVVLVEGIGAFRTGGARRITGRLPIGEYRIQVQAENACGVSAPSAVQVLQMAP